MELVVRRSWQVPALMAALLAAVMFTGLTHSAERVTASKLPQSVRLYVFDCGTLHVGDTLRFGLDKQDVSTTDLAVPCVLVAHPKGTLIWDAGAIPDADWTPTGSAVQHNVVLPGGAGARNLTLRKPLAAQLSETGYLPSDITYIALSHYHFDHTGNANAFAGATWLVRQPDRDMMLAEKAPFATRPSTYAALVNSKTIIIKSDDHDVFGDGSVILKSAPGHTPGHQILYVTLANTGRIVLSGDLYHFQESRTLQRVPSFDFNQELSRITRASIEAFLKERGAQLWIQHDFPSNAKLRKAPEYYD
jgi:N-acyl homoserine lactone hydrolase